MHTADEMVKQFQKSKTTQLLSGALLDRWLLSASCVHVLTKARSKLRPPLKITYIYCVPTIELPMSWCGQQNFTESLNSTHLKILSSYDLPFVISWNKNVHKICILQNFRIFTELYYWLLFKYNILKVGILGNIKVILKYYTLI